MRTDLDFVDKKLRSFALSIAGSEVSETWPRAGCHWNQPKRANTGLMWSCAQKSLHTNTWHSPTCSFEPEEVPGGCFYTWCIFPVGYLPHGSMAKAEEHCRELPILGADPAVPTGWIPWLWCPKRSVWLRFVPMT